jgi:hypothetical protein
MQMEEWKHSEFQILRSPREAHFFVQSRTQRSQHNELFKYDIIHKHQYVFIDSFIYLFIFDGADKKTRKVIVSQQG